MSVGDENRRGVLSDKLLESKSNNYKKYSLLATKQMANTKDIIC